MASFDVVVDTSVCDRRLTALEREQLPFARLLASNTAAYQTMVTMRKSLDFYFDRPTPWLRTRVIRYDKGTKESPAALLYIPSNPDKGAAPTDVLGHHIFGVERVAKRSERQLMRAGLISPNERVVPGEGMRLNQYGNIPSSTMVQILSAIRAFTETGFQANITERSKGRNKNRAQYFWSYGDHLPRGVYRRTGRTKTAKHKYRNLKAGRKTVQRDIEPVLLVVKATAYPKRFDFFRLAEKEARHRFKEAWPEAFARAMRTARR